MHIRIRIKQVVPLIVFTSVYGLLDLKYLVGIYSKHEFYSPPPPFFQDEEKFHRHQVKFILQGISIRDFSEVTLPNKIELYQFWID